MHYIAADFGAGSGRVMVGNLSNGMLSLEEIHRFPNRQIKAGNHFYWDFLSLLQELKTGIELAAKKYKDIAGIGIDTWGVDFGLLDEKGNLLGNPVCYRDGRVAGMMEAAFEKISKERIYNICGIQFMEFNTIFQLFAMKRSNDPQLTIAKDLLFMPDLFNYFLTGVKKNEYTEASTSSLLDAQTKSWSKEIMEALELPQAIFQDIVHPGEWIGALTKELCEELNCPPIDVFAVGSHDTASAAAVTYTRSHATAFLSSGTWSLMGLHIDKPILNNESLELNITNEGGIDNKITFLKNITGLWMLQNVVREWEQEGYVTDYAALIEEAAHVKPFLAILDPDDEQFAKPKDMRQAIVDYCIRTHQQAPVTKGEFVRVMMESLALKYRDVVKKIEQSTGRAIEQLHIVGGGSQNEMLNQFTADATGLPVMAGPVEATAIGNIIVQAIAKKEIADMDEAAEIIGNSFSVKKYFPVDTEKWISVKPT